MLVSLEFLQPGTARPARVAVFPGAYNPPTLAHVEIARAASAWADEVVWVIPRAFPHKAFDGAPFAARCAMLAELTNAYPGFSAAIADGGLYAEMADEAQAHFGSAAEIALVCGRDAAERIETWDYGQPGFVDRMLERYRLLVATRGGEYAPPEKHRHRITTLELEPAHNLISSTEVRRRIEQGGNWRELVPPAIYDQVLAIYRP